MADRAPPRWRGGPGPNTSQQRRLTSSRRFASRLQMRGCGEGRRHRAFTLLVGVDPLSPRKKLEMGKKRSCCKMEQPEARGLSGTGRRVVLDLRYSTVRCRLRTQRRQADLRSEALYDQFAPDRSVMADWLIVEAVGNSLSSLGHDLLLEIVSSSLWPGLVTSYGTTV